MMVAGVLLQMYLEYATLLVPKTGNTSLTKDILHAFVFFAFTVKAIYVWAKYKRIIKQNQMKYYPDIRLDIHGNYSYY